MALRFSKEISPETFLDVKDEVHNELLWQPQEYTQPLIFSTTD